MKVLITNDDGPANRATWTLAAHLAERGTDVILALPKENMSGVGTSIVGKLGAKTYVRRHVEGRTEIGGWLVPGTPGFIVKAACLGAFGVPPDLVLSGVNDRENVGGCVIHSGTIGAALVARSFGLTGVAVSQPDCGSPTGSLEAAVEVAGALVEATSRLERSVVLTVNVPDRPVDELVGCVPASLASFRFMRLARDHMGGYEISGADRPEPSQDSDVVLLREGYVTLTFLDGFLECGTSRVLASQVIRDVASELPGSELWQSENAGSGAAGA